MTHSQLPRLGQGFYWQDLKEGQAFQTFRRTVTETDLVNFISVTGMVEAIFIEDGYESGAIRGRPVPGALTYTLIEGFILQTMIQGTGLAMLELSQKILAPVVVGDTIWATVTVTGIRPTSRNGRAVVDSAIEVFNQRNEKVMTYTARRLLAGARNKAVAHMTQHIGFDPSISWRRQTMKAKTLMTTVAALLPAILASAAALAAPASDAGTFPAHPIRLVVPFPPGGPTDLVSRVIAKRMSDELGQQVLVDNRPGANGNIAADIVAKAPADGYTVLYNTSSIALSPALYSKLTYDVRRDFAPVVLTAMVPLVLEVNAQLPVHNVKEFIQYAKAHPDKLTYGSAGNGNVTHLAAFLFLQANGLSAVHAPYKGSAPALTDLAGGQVQFMTDTINSSLPFIRDKRMRALAVTSSTRSSQLPDVPTVAETVMPGFEVGAWQGMMVPAKTPSEIVRKLNVATMKALANPETRAALAAQAPSRAAPRPRPTRATCPPK